MDKTNKTEGVKKSFVKSECNPIVVFGKIFNLQSNLSLISKFLFVIDVKSQNQLSKKKKVKTIFGLQFF